MYKNLGKESYILQKEALPTLETTFGKEKREAGARGGGLTSRQG